MAASDPTPYVATPTGTLQGLAAFSWDGTNWQPTAGAGPDVATPTGVLRGVAPFAWDGAAWQPSGRAQPGVATPTGVLDGVAVYTWSGSAWTPASGTATPSTPSGALRGVAAFSWDGAAWQPAGQARASVPTPYGVLDGVAFFNWGGTAWNAGSAVPSGATLDLSFLSGTLDPRITFTRASTATYFDATGTMQTAGTNAPRFDYDPVTHALRGLLIEDVRINILLNSATLGTQSVAVTAQAYTLSFYGTGTVTLSGVSTAGPLVGTGAFPARVALSFTPTAGTLTLTVTGSVLNAQLEAGSFNTSWIPTTAAAVTRAQDQMSLSPAFLATSGTFVVQSILSANNNVNYCALFTANDGTNNNRMQLYQAGTTNVINYFTVNAGAQSAAAAFTMTPGTVFKVGVTHSPTGYISAFNGVSGSSDATASTLRTNVNAFTLGTGFGLATMTGYMRRFTYWPRVLSAAELQSVTT